MDPTFYYAILGFVVGFAAEFAFDALWTRKRRGMSPNPTLLANAEKSAEEANVLRAQLSELEPLRAEVARKQAEIDEMKTRFVRASADESDYAALKALQITHAEELEKANQLLQQRDAELAEARNTAAKENDASQAESQSQLMSLRTNLLDHQELLAKTQTENEVLQGRLSELEQSASQAASLVEAAGAHKAELDSARIELAHRGGRINELEQQVSQLADEAGQRASLEQHVADLERAGATKDDHIQDMENRVRSFEQELSQVRTVAEEAESAKSQLADAQHQLELSSRAEAQSTDRIQDLQGRIQGLEQELQEAQAKSSAGESAASELADTRRQVADLERELANIRSHPPTLAQAEEHEDTAALKSKVSALEADVRSLREVSASKDQAIEESRAALTQLQSQAAFAPSTDEVDRLKAELAGVRAELAETQRNKPEARTEAVAPYVVPANRDALIQIEGIGHLYERKLWEAGILTYVDLSNCNPEQIYQIIQPAEWQRIEPEQWIVEAGRRAREAAS